MVAVICSVMRGTSAWPNVATEMVFRRRLTVTASKVGSRDSTSVTERARHLAFFGSALVSAGDGWGIIDNPYYIPILWEL